MATQTEPLAPAFPEYRAASWPRLALGFSLTLGAIVLFLAGFFVAYASLHDGRALPGVSVGGVSIAGLDAAQAEARLRETLPSMSAGELTVRFADVERQIPFAAIGRDYAVALTVDQALSLGRTGDLFEQAQSQLGILLRGTSLEPSVTWDSGELARHVAAAAEAASVEPVDARIVSDNGGYTVEPASDGRVIDVERAVAVAHSAIAEASVTNATITLEPQPVAPQISTETAQAAVDRFGQVTAEPLVVVGEGARATVSADEIRGWTRLEERSAGDWAVVIEESPIVQFVEMQAAEIDQPGKDAGFAFEGEGVVPVAGEDGLVVDVEASTAAILDALHGRADGGGQPQVVLSMVVVEPDFTYEEALAVASRMEQLSRWRTNYVPGELNYSGANIRIPTDKIDGMVLEPGDTFDFWEVVGYPSVDEGYGPGAAIIRGRTVPDGALAGGICSCSTTIFNAALRAGLEMGDRRNHYYYINRYPRGLDATVWISDSGQRQTVSFTNDMEHPILIRGINRRRAVIFEIWGVPDGRTVEFTRPRIENRKPAYEVIRYTDNLRPGQTRRVEWPANGFESWVTRTVHDADGKVIHEETYFSRYARILGVTLRGRSPGDPPHGTEVPAGQVPPPSEEPPSDD